MSELFKLTFTPLVDSIDTINKYKVSVEYFNKHVIGTRFNMTNNEGLGEVVFFTKDFIEVSIYYLKGCSGETFPSKSVLNDCFAIEERHIQSYVDIIEKVKPQLEERCLEKQKKEDCEKKAFKEWQQKKPIEYSF